MRLPVVIACVIAMTTAPALACPRRVLCIIAPDGEPPAETARAPEHAKLPDLRPGVIARNADRETPLAFGDAPRRLAPGEIEMPWIWRVLREEVYARMPRYEQPKRFALVLSPVVVTSPSDTIPGVGVAGGF